MQNIVWKLGLIVAILAICLLSIFVQDLRLGKDLRGGVSLIYKVTIPEDSARNPQEILTQTIRVLKERVNPTGVLDISMQPLGRDRIEVVMPLPNQEVRDLADAYRAELAELLRVAEILPSALDDALQRGVAPAEIGGDSASERGRKVSDLQTAYNDKLTARQALDDAKSATAAAEEIRRLEGEVAAAEIRYEDLYEEVLGLSLTEARVRRTLSLPQVPQKVRNQDGSVQRDEKGNLVLGPSQREEALGRLRGDYAHLAEAIDTTVTAFDTYQKQRTGFDDPEDLIRLLRGAGVLEFHIAVTNSQPDGVDIADLRRQLVEVGPENTVSATATWASINQLKQWYDTPAQFASLEADPVGYFSQRDLVAGVYEGEYYLLIFTTRNKSITHGDDRAWSVVQTFPTSDNFGRPAVAFTLDAAGGNQMGRLTAANLRRPMAIVLDGQVYTAPTIQSQITTNGQITGNFAEDEISYLTRVLAAGSLQARLSPEPIAVSTLGPTIGQDNLLRGKNAFIISLIAVAVFMLVYYLFAGVVAVIALIANGIIIFGVMMGIDGTFTLPGLAGIVLTVGMAVDANVLIYERIREELLDADLDVRSAIREGYRKALSTILDANITNLIVCLVLFKTATTEVKGFALTLSIGIIATLFTALFVTRQIYFVYTDVFKARSLPMLPTVFPAIHRALEPSINWIGMRKMFWAVSAIVVASSVFFVAQRGVDMFDTEFRGGVSLTMLTAPIDADGDGRPDRRADGSIERLQLPLSGPDGVETRIRALADKVTGDPVKDKILGETTNAAVLTAGVTRVDAASGRVMAEAFQIKVASPKGLEDDATISDTIVAEIVETFGPQLDVTPPLAYRGAQGGDVVDFVFPITKDELGENIGRPDATQRVREFLGGAAIRLENVDPPTTTDDIAKRIDRMRNQPDYVRFSDRKVQVIGLTRSAGGANEFTDFVVLVNDPYRSFIKIDAEQWYDEVAETEWALIGSALQRPTSLEQVSSFSSAVAETLAANAIVAVILSLLGILVYIWVRFGSLRYSIAAIVALVHDVTISLGLLALSAIVGGTVFASWLLVEPFRIDLGVVAALLTIIGYSLNDTIVILDRIRENRGKRPLPTAAIVNRSINQTVSRTLLTSVTTLVAVGIMYAEGGSGIRPFTFCLLVGLVVGTYSSIAIAAPLVFTGKATDRPAPTPLDETPLDETGEDEVGLPQSA